MTKAFNLDHVAKLANLALSDEEKSSLEQDMAMILEMVDKINDVDVSGTEALASVNSLSNVSREDTIQDSLTPQAVLHEAPSANAGYVKVPKVLDKDMAD